MISTSKPEDLQARLIAAHIAGDLVELADLYVEAASLAEAEGDTDKTCFFLTHAWVYAMDADTPAADVLKTRLVSHGRDLHDTRETGEAS